MRDEVLKAMQRKKGSLIPAVHFQAVTFFDKKLERQLIILYALGEDGIVREYVGNKWNEYPIIHET